MATQRINLVEELYIPFSARFKSTLMKTVNYTVVTMVTINLASYLAKRLLLPTEQNLQRANDAEHIFFHPLSENIGCGDSAVYNWLKLAVSLRVNCAIAGLADV